MRKQSRPRPLRKLRQAVDRTGAVVPVESLIAVAEKGPLRKLQHIFLDSYYYVVPVAMWRNIVGWSKINNINYAAHHRDCDDFALMLRGQVPLKIGVNSIGAVIDYSGKHAYNAVLAFEDDGMHKIITALIEPQTDGFVNVGQRISDAEIYAARRGFVIW